MKLADLESMVEALLLLVQSLSKQVDEMAERIRVLEQRR